jgi:hypothetical protein
LDETGYVVSDLFVKGSGKESKDYIPIGVDNVHVGGFLSEYNCLAGAS